LRCPALLRGDVGRLCVLCGFFWPAVAGTPNVLFL
jgi:hypothetical protein